MLPYLIHIRRLHQVPRVSKPGNPKVEAATIGILRFLKIEGFQAIPQYTCITIENGGDSSPLPNRDKRIMPGEYYLGLQDTSVPLPREHQNKGLMLTSPMYPDFSSRRIFLHAGNYPQDTQGCILLQSHYDFTQDPGYGGGSMRATCALYNLVIKAKPEKVMVLVYDEPTPTKSLAYLRNYD